MFTDIRITSFHGFLGIHDIPMWLTVLTTIFLMIVIINAVNLIDGIDGLAATTGIIASVTFGIWFWKSADF
jgi:UDP-N-acetylmuramyl pentapeptide phosphotransferase/UDP-N-acetylglucosamine-1-phosphate transferase